MRFSSFSIISLCYSSSVWAGPVSTASVLTTSSALLTDCVNTPYSRNCWGQFNTLSNYYDEVRRHAETYSSMIFTIQPGPGHRRHERILVRAHEHHCCPRWHLTAGASGEWQPARPHNRGRLGRHGHRARAQCDAEQRLDDPFPRSAPKLY